MTWQRFSVVPIIALLALPPVLGVPDVGRTQVQEFVKSYIDAQNKVDASGQMEMVSRKPAVSSISMGEIVRGWEAIRADVDKVVGSEGQFKISIGTIDVEVLGTNYALAFAPCTITFHAAEGDVQLRGAISLVLEKSAGKWKVLHEHSSAQLPEVEGD